MELSTEWKRKLHVIACKALGLDDEDHEDDEIAAPLENALAELLLAYSATQSKQHAIELIDARIDAVEQARSRVLRRTEIPKDAKNPTRDYVVVLGEEIAGIIEHDITALQAQKQALLNETPDAVVGQGEG